MAELAGSDQANRPGLGPWRMGLDPEFTPFPDSLVGTSVAARLLDVAETFAEHDALRSPAGVWTYADLRADAARVAATVSSVLAGDEPEPVAILAAHDGPLVVAMIGILLAEHIIVVVDPSAPAAQHQHALAESGARLILHDDAHADAARALATGPSAPALANIGEVVQGRPVPAPVPAGGAGHPIMLAFTSGTSGTSKASVITNGVLMNLIRGATDALGIGPTDRMPMLFPTSLAVAAYPLFLPLLNGGTLATLDVRSVGLAPVADFLADERITLAYMAPTVVRFLVDALAGRSFPDLRMIALGGELVDAEVVELTARLLGPPLIANGFGTTETGVITLYVLDPADPIEGTVPAGYPVPDVELVILDDQGAEVAQGASGEVAVISPYVFPGYWGHHELDAQVLAPDPRGRADWQLYRTGDLGRLDEHGALTVLGRLDTKVKVRGRFVVLGDVEALLHTLPELADAAVVASTADGITELTAVVTAAEGATVDPAALRARLLEHEEAYRVPTRWTLVPELPRLPNGKVDRRRLEVPAHPAVVPLPTGASTRQGAVPSPAEPPEPAQLQRMLRDLWETLLPVATVGLDDDFEELGGHSLLAAQMLVMLEQQTQIVVPMSTLVRSRTIRSLAAAIEALPVGEPSTVAMVQAGDPDTRPRLWFVHDLPGSAYRVRHLARHLGADQPVWSFESPFLRGERNPYTHLDTFVASYLRDLVVAQPEGPYWLAGYSFGGICAYEMARQLRRDGHEVAFTGIVDVGPGYRGPGWSDHRSPAWPYFGVPHPPPPGASAPEVARHYATMAKTSPRGALRHLTLRSGAARHLDRVRFEADLSRSGRVRPEWRLWYAWEEHWKLAAKHWDRTSPYDGAVDLLWADQTGASDGTMGWGPLVADLTIHRFPGTHEQLLEPSGSPALGAALRAVIDHHLTSEPRPAP